MWTVAKRVLKRAAIKMEPVDIVETVPVETASLPKPKKEVFDVSFWPGRRLVLSSFKGRILVHIREYLDMGGKEYPTKKGVCLTPGRLSALRRRIEEIDELLVQLSTNAEYNVTIGDDPLYYQHLGGGIYASINEKYHGVDLRRYWSPMGQSKPVPTRNGIYLPASQWTALKLKLDELLEVHPGLADSVECALAHGGNQLEYFGCPECMPFGYDCL